MARCSHGMLLVRLSINQMLERHNPGLKCVRPSSLSLDSAWLSAQKHPAGTYSHEICLFLCGELACHNIHNILFSSCITLVSPLDVSQEDLTSFGKLFLRISNCATSVLCVITQRIKLNKIFIAKLIRFLHQYLSDIYIALFFIFFRNIFLYYIVVKMMWKLNILQLLCGSRLFHFTP